MATNKRQVFVYDTSKRVARATPHVYSAPADPTPKLETIQSWLQNPLGVSGPTSILTLDSNGRLDELKVDTIKFATLDGGNF